MIHGHFDDELISQLAAPASPLLKMNKVTGVRKSSVHSVSIKLTETQKAMMTQRMTATLPIMSIPQKSMRARFAFMELWLITYRRKVPTIAITKAKANYNTSRNVNNDN